MDGDVVDERLKEMKGLVPVDPNGGNGTCGGRICQDGPANAGWDGNPLKIVLVSGMSHWGGFLESLHDLSPAETLTTTRPKKGGIFSPCNNMQENVLVQQVGKTCLYLHGQETKDVEMHQGGAQLALFVASHPQ